jgi:hypothetical protein
MPCASPGGEPGALPEQRSGLAANLQARRVRTALLTARKSLGAAPLYVPSLPTLDPRLALAPPMSPWQRWPGLAGARVELFYLARAGVYRAVRHLAAGRVALLPAYHHGVEVEAVRAAGARVRFYRVDENLEVDLDDLARRALDPDVGLIYLTHYLGFAQPIAEVAAIAEARGVPLFEDCALSLFARAADGSPLGTTGAASVFCLYKTLPVPHGGLLRTTVELPREAVAPPPILSTLHHAVGLALAGLELRAPRMGGALRAAARALARRTVGAVVDNVQTGTMHLEPRDLELGASGLVSAIAARCDPDVVVAQRRRNFTRLAEALDGVAPVIGAPLPPGACPLFVPVRVADKGRRLERLRARGVDAIDFWSTGDPACPAGDFPEAARLRREVLELPCHQSLGDDEIDRLAAVARAELG